MINTYGHFGGSELGITRTMLVTVYQLMRHNMSGGMKLFYHRCETIRTFT